MIPLLFIIAYKINEFLQYHKTPSGAKCTPYFYRKVSNSHPEASQNLHSQVRIPHPKNADKKSKFTTQLKPFQEIS